MQLTLQERQLAKSRGYTDDEINAIERERFGGPEKAKLSAALSQEEVSLAKSRGYSDEEIQARASSILKPAPSNPFDLGQPPGGRLAGDDPSIAWTDNYEGASPWEQIEAAGKTGVESFASGIAGIPVAAFQGLKQTGKEILGMDDKAEDTPVLSAGGRILGATLGGFEDAREGIFGARYEGKEGDPFWKNTRQEKNAMWPGQGPVWDMPEDTEAGQAIGDFVGNVVGVFTGATEAKLLGLIPRIGKAAPLLKQAGGAEAFATQVSKALKEIPTAVLKDVENWSTFAGNGPKVAAIEAEIEEGLNVASAMVDEAAHAKAILREQEHLAKGGQKHILYEAAEVSSRPLTTAGTHAANRHIRFKDEPGIVDEMFTPFGVGSEKSWDINYPKIREAGETVTVVNINSFKGMIYDDATGKLLPGLKETDIPLLTHRINLVFNGVLKDAMERSKAYNLRMFHLDNGSVRITGDSKTISRVLIDARKQFEQFQPPEGAGVRWLAEDEVKKFVKPNPNWKGPDDDYPEFVAKFFGKLEKLDPATGEKVMVKSGWANVLEIVLEDGSKHHIPFYKKSHGNEMFAVGRGMDEYSAIFGMKADQARQLKNHAKNPSKNEPRIYGHDMEDHKRTPVDAIWDHAVSLAQRHGEDSLGPVYKIGAVEKMEKELGPHNLLLDVQIDKDVEKGIAGFHKNKDPELEYYLTRLSEKEGLKITEADEFVRFMEGDVPVVPPRAAQEAVQAVQELAIESKPGSGGFLDDLARAVDEELTTAVETIAENMPPGAVPPGKIPSDVFPGAAKVVADPHGQPATDILPMGSIPPPGAAVPGRMQVSAGLILDEVLKRIMQGPPSAAKQMMAVKEQIASPIGMMNKSRATALDMFLRPIQHVLREMGGIPRAFIDGVDAMRGLSNQLKNKPMHALKVIIDESAIGNDMQKRAGFLAVFTGKVSAVDALANGVSQRVVDAAIAAKRLEVDWLKQSVMPGFGPGPAHVLANAKYLTPYRKFTDLSQITAASPKQTLDEIGTYLQMLKQEGGQDMFAVLNRVYSDVSTDQAMLRTFGSGLDDTDSVINMYASVMKKLANRGGLSPRELEYFEYNGKKILDVFSLSADKQWDTKRRVMAGVRNFETLTKLPLAGIRNATQLGITAIASGETLRTFNEVAKWVTDIKSIRGGIKFGYRKEAITQAIEWGALTDSMIHALDLGADAPLSEIAGAMLKVTGFNSTEVFNRVISAQVGAAFMKKTGDLFSEALVAGNSYKRTFYGNRLREMGVDVVAFANRGGNPSAEDLAAGGRWLVNNSQFSTNPETLPGLWLELDRGRWGEITRTTMQFKQFSYKNLTSLYENLYRSHVRAAYDAGAKNTIEAHAIAARSMVPEWGAAAPGLAAGVGLTWAATMVAGIMKGEVVIPGVTGQEDWYIDPLKKPADDEQFVKLVANMLSLDLFTRGLMVSDLRRTKTGSDDPLFAASIKSWMAPVAYNTFKSVYNGIMENGIAWTVGKELPLAKGPAMDIHNQYEVEGEFMGGIPRNIIEGAPEEPQPPAPLGYGEHYPYQPEQAGAPSQPPWEGSQVEQSSIYKRAEEGFDNEAGRSRMRPGEYGPEVPDNIRLRTGIGNSPREDAFLDKGVQEIIPKFMQYSLRRVKDKPVTMPFEDAQRYLEENYSSDGNSSKAMAFYDVNTGTIVLTDKYGKDASTYAHEIGHPIAMGLNKAQFDQWEHIFRQELKRNDTVKGHFAPIGMIQYPDNPEHALAETIGQYMVDPETFQKKHTRVYNWMRAVMGREYKALNTEEANAAAAKIPFREQLEYEERIRRLTGK